jgi:cell division protein FtsB
LHGEDVGITPEDKQRLDELHKRKIDLADEVLILNVGGYIGESTKSELEYARANGKTIRFLEPDSPAPSGEKG